MFIENCAAADMPQAFHKDPGPNSMLIQITDPASWRATPKHEFLDAEDECGFPEETKFSDEQAMDMVGLLLRAKSYNMNVIVHCFAGLCRSGAVAEVGMMLGFEDTGRVRRPNARVKTKMMKVLGWEYEG
jgi:protein tyrosine phosphatase